MSGVLDGLKVIEMGQIESAPMASAWLSDWGADVIKVEPPTGENWMVGPRKGLPGPGPLATVDAWWSVYQMINRNKRGLAINLKSDAGRGVLYQLIKDGDVFLTNYQEDALKNLKLDYATVRAVNPRLVYAVISAFGANGPDKDRGGADETAGFYHSGYSEVTREPGSPPLTPPLGLVDRAMAAPNTVAGILAALWHREHTGKGQKVEVSLYQSAVYGIALPIQFALAGASLKYGDRENRDPMSNNFRTSDDRCFHIMGTRSENAWPNFCKSADMPELAADPRFDTPEKRLKNAAALTGIIDKTIASHTMAEWADRFAINAVGYVVLKTPDDVVNDPQAIANRFFAELTHPKKKIKIVASPVNFVENPSTVRGPAPDVGQHNEEILKHLGYGAEQIARLRSDKVIP